MFPGDRTDHMSVRYLMYRYRPRQGTGRSAGPDSPPPAPHGADSRRPARCDGRATAGARAHASQAAMAIYQHATLDRDRSLAEKIGQTYDARCESRRSE